MKVKFIREEHHIENPEFYPPVGTVGVVIRKNSDGMRVQWPTGSTSDDDQWECGEEQVEVIEN